MATRFHLIRVSLTEATLTEKKQAKRAVPEVGNRMPTNSIFYDKMVPIVLLSLGLITIILIVVAAGIFFGYFG